MSTAVPFPLFMAVWNRVQKQGTPRVHVRIARWLQARNDAGDGRLLLMAFRSCGKSTLVGLFAAWLLWRNPTLRILVLAADSVLAGKMVRQTKRIIERHPLTAALRPDRPDQWAADRFTVRRDAEWRDPSMLACGIGTNITGSRADMVICDDVEVPKTCETAEKREDLRARLAELSFVLVPGGTQIYVGTPHHNETIYDDGFLHGYAALRVPLLRRDGRCVWPERFSPADIDRLKRSGGPRRFAAQMMLQPVAVEDSRLNVEALRWYADIPDDVAIKARSAWWDPAFGQGDGSVVAVVYADDAGGYRLHRLLYVRIDARDATDEATQQCRAVAALCRDAGVNALHVETNGLGRFLPSILRRELAGAAAVIEVTSTRPKDVRIIEGFDAVLAARALHVHDSVRATPFVSEMREWKPGGRGRDDGLDAVAGALSRLPVMGGRKNTIAARARTDFNVME